MRLYKNDHLRAYKVVLGVCNAEELRTYNGNIYREFFIFDDGQIVVLFNGFQKKTQKTPNNEIEKALKIKEAYYADK